MQSEETKLNEKINRPWGYYTVIAQGEGFQTKIIHVNPKQRLSVQSHNYRSEHWFVLSGCAKVLLNNDFIELKVGQSIDIPIKAVHSLQNEYDKGLEVLEIQMGEILSENDITRYEDIYGRV